VNLAQAILVFVLAHFAPGKTGFSVEPAPGGKFSSFYGTTVKRETYETGAVRYRRTLEVLVRSAHEIHGETKTRKFTVTELAVLATGVMIQEGGLREDVQKGRGWAKKADDVGGRGRGPGKEACSAQIHPLIAWKYADTTPELRKAAEAGDRKAREAIAKALIGTDEAALSRCFRTQMRMLIRGAEWCAGRSNLANDWHAVAMYVSGESCTADPFRKTSLRVNLARRIKSSLDPEAKPVSVAGAAPACSIIKYQRPVGWIAIERRTPAMAAWARALHALQLPLETTRERLFETGRVLARVDMHCDAERGPHRGVSLFRPEARP
jgi:hypothetical protein